MEITFPKRRGTLLPGALMAVAAIVIGGCARTPEQKAARFLDRGKTMFQKKDYARALLEFRSAAQFQPRRGEVHYRMGLSYAALGDFPHAVLAYQRAVEFDPSQNDARLKLAELMATSEKKEILEQVERMAAKALAFDPGSGEALRIRALAEMRLGDLEKAAGTLREAVAKSPANVQAAVTLAATKLVQRDGPGAEAVMKNLAAGSPSAESWRALGRFYRLTGKDAAADDAVRKAAQAGPDNPEALFDLAAMQIRQRRPDQADATLQRLASLPDPRFRDAHARFLFSNGKSGEAIREYEKLYAKHSEDRALRSSLAAAYMTANRPAQAEEMLVNALKRNPKDSDALLLRARLRIASGKLDEAGADLAQILTLQPDSADAHYWKARLLRIRNQRPQSDAELGEVIRLAPDWLDARLELVQSLRAGHHPETALAYLDNMPAAQKGILDTIVNRGWLLFDLRRDTELQALLGRALAVRRDPPLLLQQALLQMRRRQFAPARASLDEILRAQPADTRAVETMLAWFLAQNQNPASLAWLGQYVQQQPGSAPLRFVLGQWQAEFGNLPAARSAYQQALSIDAKFKPARLELAKLDLASGNLDAARGTLDELLKADPGDIPARMTLAALEEKAGNAGEAAQHYQVVLAADPNHVVALNNLAFLLATYTAGIDQALAYASKAGELAPDSAAVNDTLGWICYRKQLYQRAVQHLETAVKLVPTPVRKTHLALSYYETGRRQLARKLIDEALAEAPQLAEAQAAKAKVSAP